MPPNSTTTFFSPSSPPFSFPSLTSASIRSSTFAILPPTCLRSNTCNSNESSASERKCASDEPPMPAPTIATLLLSPPTAPSTTTHITASITILIIVALLPSFPNE
ncbi:MAG: hypothetical protein Q8P67_16190 [archaeon]|nr:hypothetical protein [archaeon]